jgi:hypothetical protein
LEKSVAGRDVSRLPRRNLDDDDDDDNDGGDDDDGGGADNKDNDDLAIALWDHKMTRRFKSEPFAKPMHSALTSR